MKGFAIQAFFVIAIAFLAFGLIVCVPTAVIYVVTHNLIATGVAFVILSLFLIVEVIKYGLIMLLK